MNVKKKKVILFWLPKNPDLDNPFFAPFQNTSPNRDKRARIPSTRHMPPARETRDGYIEFPAAYTRHDASRT